MSRCARILRVFAAVVFVNGSAYVTLTANLRAGAYPVDGDSIQIPLVSTALSSVLILLLLALSIALPMKGFGWIIASLGLASLSLALSALIALAWILAGFGHLLLALGWISVAATARSQARDRWTRWRYPDDLPPWRPDP